MDFRILGPLEVRDDIGAVALGGVKPRAVLAVLLLHADEPVSAERLAHALWGEDAPAGAAKTVQVYISRLRKALGDPGIVATTPAGYRLRLADDELDATRFGRLVEDGRRALGTGRPEYAATLLRDALEMWRGPPLADLAFEPFAAPEITRLEEQRQSALESRVDADLAAGRHTALVGELQRLVALYPTRERLAGQLMLALYRCGRQAEALEAYRDARGRLVAEAGVEPGPELRRLHDEVLRQDPSLDAPAPAAELPEELDTAAAPPLAGQEAELGALHEWWRRARDGKGALVGLSGVTGIGKTRLAAELACEVHRTGATVLYAAAASRAEPALAAVRAARDAGSPTLLVVDAADRAAADLRAAVADLARAVDGLPVLVLATGEDAGALASLGATYSLALKPLGAGAVAAIARAYGTDLPVEWLAEARGVPQRVHELAGEWARQDAARRVEAVAGRTASGRAQLRSMEAELAGGVADLQAAREHAAAIADEDATVVCPFKGLASFDVDDAEYFFGRERLIAELVARLVGAPLLGIVGPSGSGKSSVLRAGLLPALAGGVLPGSEERQQMLIRPGEHPLEELNRAGAAVADESRTVLAVDQFEEVFTACRDERERTAFIASLVHAAQDTNGRCVVVLAVRADHYERCAAYPELSKLLAANHVLVTSMRRDELRQTVERPARRVGLRVEPELTDALVADVEGAPGALPVLSAALLELWQQRDGRRLRHAAYERTGGVRGAVARLAEEAFGQLDPAQQAVARSTLVRLAVEGSGGSVERRRVPLAELGTQSSDDVARVVELFTDRRLLTISAGSVEVAHEALLREWPRLQGWIQEDREGLRIHRGVTAAADEWRRLDRDEGALFRGTHLTEASEWRESHHPALNELEREFLDTSAAREERERSARRRRITIAFAGLTVALAAISAVAIVALYQAREAERQRDIGASRELAFRAASVLDSDPGLSLAVALQGLDRWDTREAENAVRRATNAADGTGVWQLHDDWLWAVRRSRDGDRVVTSGKDGTVRIWDVDRRRVESTIEAHRGEVQDASLSPDGLQVASAGADDGTVTISDPLGGHRRVVLDLGSGTKKPRPVGVQFSRDGQRLAVAVSDGTVRIIPLDGRGAITRLSGHGGYVYSASFSPDGNRLVSAGQDGTARIWDVAGGTSLQLEHPAAVESAIYSPDGKHVATAGADGMLRIWDAVADGVPTTIRLGREPLLSVRYSPDGRRLVTAGGDGVVRVLDVRTASVIAVLRGHRGQALSADFIAGGGAVVSAGEDGTLRTWAPAPVTVIRAHPFRVSVSPSGRFVTGGQESGAVAVWDLATGTRQKLPAHAFPSFVKFSADGRRIGSASWDGEVRVSDPSGSALRRVPSGALAKYSVALDRHASRIAFGGSDTNPRVVIEPLSGGRRVVLTGHTEAINDVEFSPDGAHLITASEDGTARIWNAVDGRRERTLEGHGEGLRTARYSADGKRVVTAGKDGTARVWRVADGSSRILRGHEGPASSAAFNRSGDRVVTAGEDGTVRAWSAAGGESLLVLDAHQGGALDAAFISDGRRVVSVGEDGVMRVVSCEACGPFSEVLRLARARTHESQRSRAAALSDTRRLRGHFGQCLVCIVVLRTTSAARWTASAIVSGKTVPSASSPIRNCCAMSSRCDSGNSGLFTHSPLTQIMLDSPNAPCWDGMRCRWATCSSGMSNHTLSSGSTKRRT